MLARDGLTVSLSTEARCSPREPVSVQARQGYLCTVEDAWKCVHERPVQTRFISVSGTAASACV